MKTYEVYVKLVVPTTLEVVAESEEAAKAKVIAEEFDYKSQIREDCDVVRESLLVVLAVSEVDELERDMDEARLLGEVQDELSKDEEDDEPRHVELPPDPATLALALSRTR